MARVPSLFCFGWHRSPSPPKQLQHIPGKRLLARSQQEEDAHSKWEEEANSRWDNANTKVSVQTLDSDEVRAKTRMKKAEKRFRNRSVDDPITLNKRAIHRSARRNRNRDNWRSVSEINPVDVANARLQLSRQQQAAGGLSLSGQSLYVPARQATAEPTAYTQRLGQRHGSSLHEDNAGPETSSRLKSRSTTPGNGTGVPRDQGKRARRSRSKSNETPMQLVTKPGHGAAESHHLSSLPPIRSLRGSTGTIKVEVTLPLAEPAAKVSNSTKQSRRSSEESEDTVAKAKQTREKSQHAHPKSNVDTVDYLGFLSKVCIVPYEKLDIYRRFLRLDVVDQPMISMHELRSLLHPLASRGSSCPPRPAPPTCSNHAGHS